MTKNDLIKRAQDSIKAYQLKDISHAVNVLFDAMKGALIRGERIEVRGFGNFTIRNHNSKTGRNPKTSEVVHIPVRKTIYFKASQEIKLTINSTKNRSVT
jgi:integration host factor subunit beta